MRGNHRMNGSDSTDPILQIEDLSTQFSMQEGIVRAVVGLSYHVSKGETLGVVGESGCGKSVAALSILRLIPVPPGKIVSGRIRFMGKDLLELPMKRMRKVRGAQISMVFQDPMTSFNPVFTVGYQLSKVFMLHRKLSRKEARNRSIEILEACEIPSPERIMNEYPHQLSGGMRQRVMIAMALGCNPRVLIADEPTTALDVTIQAEILDLILRLKEQFGMAMILITHDLGIIANSAQRVVVMYAGEKVEEADVFSLFEKPRHPYTSALMKSVPRLGSREKFLSEIAGVVPSPFRKISGCKFAERCPEAMDRCRNESPRLRDIEKGHSVACHL
jgi:oligopeptide/dipeptide ABC transporter ATP-binding protein